MSDPRPQLDSIDAHRQLDSLTWLFSHSIAFDGELRLVHLGELTAKALGLDPPHAIGRDLDALCGRPSATRLRATLAELDQLPLAAVIEGPGGAMELGWIRLGAPDDDTARPLLVGLAASRLPGVATMKTAAGGSGLSAREPMTVEQLAFSLAVGETDEIAYLIDDDYRVQMLDGRGQGQRRCYEVVHDRREPCEGCLVELVKRSGKPAWRERMRGERRQRLTLYPLGAGDDRRLLEVVRDVTRETELEERLVQADRLSALGELVAGVAHEVNNPNGVIQGNLRIVAEAMDDLLELADARAAEEPDYQVARLPYGYFRNRIGQLILDMQESSERIESVVGDLRHFAIRGDGKASEPVDLNPLARRALRLLERRLGRAAHVKLTLAARPPVVLGSGQKLEQVLVNLLLNAAHAIEERPSPGLSADQREDPLVDARGHIEVRTITRSGVAVLEVVDDGVGIDERLKRRLFDPFFSTRRARGGTGLGLSIAFAIVSEHGGTIEVDSSPGEGSVFRLTFPLVAAAGDESAADDEAQEQQPETSL